MKNIAIITGASSGLGIEFALQIDKKYQLDEIWLIARREDRLIELASKLQRAKGVVLALDLQDKNSINTIVTKLTAEQSNLRLLVNNAGYGKYGKFTQQSITDIQGMIDLNITALVELTHAAIPFMQPGAGIINLASSAGYLPLGNFNVYAATKAFVLHFSIALGAELNEIDVLAVCPGPVATEFFQVAQGGSNSFYMVKADAVVRHALRNLGWSSTAIYSLPIKLVVWLSRLLPKSLIARLMR
jgi:hypothetical protein